MASRLGRRLCLYPPSHQFVEGGFSGSTNYTSTEKFGTERRRLLLESVFTRIVTGVSFGDIKVASLLSNGRRLKLVMGYFCLLSSTFLREVLLYDSFPE